MKWLNAINKVVTTNNVYLQFHVEKICLILTDGGCKIGI